MKILHNIGYDAVKVETFIFFQEDYNRQVVKNAEITNKLKQALRFISKRQRAW